MQEARELIFGPKEKHLSIYLKLVLFGPKCFVKGRTREYGVGPSHMHAHLTVFDMHRFEENVSRIP